MKKKIRIVLAKAGLDGHDRGINIIKDSLINEGCEVFYFSLYRNLDDIAEIAVQEGADFIGLSIHSGAHKKYVEKVFERLKNHNALDIGLILGGIIPEKDEEFLKEKFGVKKIFVSGTPEADLNAIKNFFRENPGRTIAAITALKTKNDVGLAISAISNGLEMEKIRENWPGTLTLGVTGPLGAGKSSLTDKLIAEFRTLDKKVGVITVDPSDFKTDGAPLGRDRTQMWRHLYDSNVHIYSLATRGCQGGIAEATAKAAEIMRAAGYDIVLIETIGVGQDQTAIKNIADKVLLVLTPDIGEDQIYKSGIMQIADYYILNKTDIINPLKAEKHINEMLDQKNLNIRPLVFKTISAAPNNNGVRELVKEINPRI
ncbi:MAG: cobalamin-dependent protein [Patescibacteria group bacterium]